MGNSEEMALLNGFVKRCAEHYREWEGRAAELAEEVKVRLSKPSFNGRS